MADQKRNKPLNEREEYLLKLHKQLDTVLKGQAFANSDAGKLIIEMLQTDVSTFTKEVMSNKFIDDHSGYLDARAKGNYAASLLGRLLGAADGTKEATLRQQIKAADPKKDKAEADSGTGE